MYNDSLLKPSPQSDELVASIKDAKRVILTHSIPSPGQNSILFKRDGYIALYAVDDVEFDDEGLRFRFTERLCDLK